MGGRKRRLVLTLLSPLLLFRLDGDAGSFFVLFCSLACTIINFSLAAFFLQTRPFIYQ